MKLDQIFINGNILTMDKENSIPEAIGVTNNKISFIGSKKDIEHYIDNNTKINDLNGKTLMPGFIDSHVHLLVSGLQLIDYSISEKADSIQDVYDLVKEAANNAAQNEWIRIWGFNENNFKEKTYPDINVLDQLAPNNPISIIRICNHISIANTVALKKANITENIKDPQGGKYGRNINGQLNGILYEQAHMKISNYFAPSEADIMKALQKANDYFLSYGITSVHDAGGYGDGIKILNTTQKAIEKELLQIRIYQMIGSLTNCENFIQQAYNNNLITNIGTEKLKIGPAKLFLDGSSTGPTISTRKPYKSNNKDYGILYYTESEIMNILGKANNLGYQITAHAQGDNAVEFMINCIEQAQQMPDSGTRNRIEHAGITPSDLQNRIKKNNIIPVPNPAFIYYNGEVYKKHYGERVETMYPLKDYSTLNIVAPIGSDAPVVDVNPFIGLRAAITRLTKDGNIIGGNQRISLFEALKAYTIYGAFASFDDHVKGSIELGKFADLILLNKDITKVDPKNIHQLYVEKTYVDGNLVYEKTL